MTSARSVHKSGGLLMLLLAFLVAVPASAERLVIGYLELADDPRYQERSAYARIALRSQSRPQPGAQLGIADAQRSGRFLERDFELAQFRGNSLDALLQQLQTWQKQSIHFVLLDLPAQMSAELAAKTRSEDLLLFNVSAAEDRLRGADCQAHLLHTLPSEAMLSDALLQYLVSKRWRELLLLQGPLPEDAQRVQALQRSIKRFGAKLVATRPFELGNDPRNRERNNIALLTQGDYDAVIVADSEGEFGRYVPYQTKAARPVVGSTGLQASAWSWVWERHGAPQVNERFAALAGRHMQAADWAAWAAVSAIAQSALRSRSLDFAAISDYLRSDNLRLDGSKGPALSFRPWNNQLRQPILLATHDAVIARAPLDGFLHPQDTLDTLGVDAAESSCQLAAAGRDTWQPFQVAGGADG